MITELELTCLNKSMVTSRHSVSDQVEEQTKNAELLHVLIGHVHFINVFNRSCGGKKKKQEKYCVNLPFGEMWVGGFTADRTIDCCCIRIHNRVRKQSNREKGIRQIWVHIQVPFSYVFLGMPFKISKPGYISNMGITIMN